MKKLLLLGLIAIIHQSSFSQDSTNNWTPSAGLVFSSIAVNNVTGIDTAFTNTVTLAPFVAIRSKGGWGVTYSPWIVLGGPTPGIFMHTLKAGVEQYDKTHLDYTFNYTHYFFTGNQSVPFSPLTNEIDASIAFKKIWFRPILRAGVGFGTDTTGGSSSSAYDIGISAGVSHLFSWKTQFLDYTFTPRALINAGTNQYFSFLNITKYIGHTNKSIKYIKTHTNSGTGNGNGGAHGGNSSTAPEKLGISNFELGFESSLEKGPFSLRPDCSLFIPVGNEAGSGLSGYWQMTLEYNF